MAKFNVGDFIWMAAERKKGKVLSIDTKKKEIVVSYFPEQGKRDTVIKKLWEVSRYKEKDKIYFAKVRPDAKIPSKRVEDAAFDFYSCFDEDMIVLHPNVPTLIPTGIASAFSSKYRLNLKHERSSTGKYGISILSGMIDSGFRGMIFLNLTNLNNKPIAITKEVNEVQITEDYILYPYCKAIAQGTLEFVPNVNVKEITYEKLRKIPSERGVGCLDSTGK